MFGDCCRRKEANVIGSRSTAEDTTSFLFAFHADAAAATTLEFHPKQSISPARIAWLTTFTGQVRDGRQRITPQKLDSSALLACSPPKHRSSISQPFAA
ncbi:hypothetical protein MA16_Dca012524 [Dendrobium catenatum]|uniref:Uncharacterized protein n=1 Tax=Dendrobium catenatum TaxID=906689 RepID=A0A2I0W535_9ASPA|nr:hypothetical protein MA16_Dca012524 [Dendrobium catenatum]